MAHITLNYEGTSTGYRMTFEDGSTAGMIVYNAGHGTWQHIPPNARPALGEYGPTRQSRQAAEYDALAWAEEFAATHPDTTS